MNENLPPKRAFPDAMTFFGFAVATLLAAISIGCDRQSGGTPSVATTTPAAAQGAPAEIRVGYYANLTHAQGVLGVSNGDYASVVAPAKLSTKVFNAGPSLIEALFAGEIDLGYVGPGPAINGHGKSRGQGVRIVS